MAAALTNESHKDFDPALLSRLKELGHDGDSILRFFHDLTRAYRASCEENECLRERLILSGKLKYGRKGECFVRDHVDGGIDGVQILLGLFVPVIDLPVEMPSSAESTIDTSSSGASGNEPTQPEKKKRSKKSPDLSKLRRQITLVTHPETNAPCPCCGQPRRKMVETTSERLCHKPAELFVEEFRLEVLVCDECEGNIERAPHPAAHLGRSLADPSLLAELIVSKFVYGIPTHRSLKRFADTTGVKLCETTVDRWIAETLESFRPLASYAQSELIRCGLVSIDDSFLQALMPIGQRLNNVGTPDPKGKTTQSGHMWFALGNVNEVAFAHYTPNWKARHLDEILSGFKNRLQGDGYAGFDSFCLNRKLPERAGCMDHARRGFVHASKLGHRDADGIGVLIDKLYKLEDQMKGKGLPGPEAIQEWRNEHEKPVFDELSRSVHELYARYGQKKGGLLRKALVYFIKQERKLRVYLSDGRVPISNIHVEQKIRIFAIMRAACKQTGSPAAGRRIGYGLTAVLNAILAGVPIYEYFEWLVDAARKTAADGGADLMPQAWAERRRTAALSVA